MSVFLHLPISAEVENRIFCISGGLSRTAHMLREIQAVERRVEIPGDGPMCEFFWSNPNDVRGWSISRRGPGYSFGWDITDRFMRDNGLELVVVGNQLCREGYSWYHDRKLVAICSAPNYWYKCRN